MSSETKSPNSSALIAEIETNLWSAREAIYRAAAQLTDQATALAGTDRYVQQDHAWRVRDAMRSLKLGVENAFVETRSLRMQVIGLEAEEALLPREQALRIVDEGEARRARAYRHDGESFDLGTIKGAP